MEVNQQLNSEERPECARCLALDHLRAMRDEEVWEAPALRMLLAAFAISAGRMCGPCLGMEGRPLLQRLSGLGAFAGLLSLVLAVFVAGCGGHASKASSCAAPHGEWALSLKSSDCGNQSLHEDFTKLDAADACVLVSQGFDDGACVFSQQASCDGFDATIVFTLDKAATKLTGTTTIENADGSVCDFDVTGHR